MRYLGFNAAYLDQVARLLDHAEFRNAPRGNDSQEVLGARFVLENPRRRLVTAGSRRSNIVFNFAEALWYFAGRDDLAYLSYYAPGVARFVSGASSLTGTAYGPRIFRHGQSEVDQWRSVVDTLAEDPDSKRAVVSIFQPEELRVSNNPDVACTIALQFLLRERRLHCIGFMRANDVYRGMVSDVFSFTFLQELLAHELGVDLGTYTHMVGSLHLYAPDITAAERLGSEPDDHESPMPAMPRGDQRPFVTGVMGVEEELRANRRRLECRDLAGLGLPWYWTQVLVLFELYRRVRYDGPRDSADLLAFLHPVYRRMTVNKFPALLGRRMEVAS